MTRGVLYYNRGTGAAVRLLVSLASLRRHYAGPVTIRSDGEDSRLLCERIAGALGADLQTWTPDIPQGRHTTYLAKTLYHTVSPYEVTICLDNDTLIVGAFDELFDFAERSGFAVAQLADWRSNGATIIGMRSSGERRSFPMKCAARFCFPTTRTRSSTAAGTARANMMIPRDRIRGSFTTTDASIAGRACRTMVRGGWPHSMKRWRGTLPESANGRQQAIECCGVFSAGESGAV